MTIASLKNPRAALAVGNGRALVTEAGEIGRAGDGQVSIVERAGRVTLFTVGLDDPAGMASVGDSLFVADRAKVWRIDRNGTATIHAGPASFPRPATGLLGLTPDGRGGLFASDRGDRFGSVYRLDPSGRASLVLDGLLASPQVERPGGLLVDDPDHVFVADMAWGHLYRVGLVTGTPERVGSGFGAVEAIARGSRSRLFLGDGRGGRLFEVASDLEPPRSFLGPWRSVSGLSTTADGRTLLVPDPEAGTLTWFPVP